MKTFFTKSTIIYLGIVCCLVLFSCVSVKPQLATVKAPTRQNEVAVSENLKSFLAKNKKFSVVLRTPKRPDNITISQKEEDDINYTELERALINAGFDVKDRASVNNVVNQIEQTAKHGKEDIFDYKQIGEILNVDMFIEITALSFNMPFSQNKYKVKATGVQYDPSDGVLNTVFAQFSFRLVIAQTGSVGGMFTIYWQSCAEGCDFYVLFRKGQYELYQHLNQLGSEVASKGLNWSIKDNKKEVATYFASQLVNALQNKL